MPNSVSNHLKVDMEDILDPDERTNDIEEERRAAEHDSEFYDGDRDQDGDTMPLPPTSSNNAASTAARSNGGTGTNSSGNTASDSDGIATK